MMAGAAPQTLLDRLTLQEKWLAARLEGIRAIKPPLQSSSAPYPTNRRRWPTNSSPPHMGMMAMKSAMSGSDGPRSDAAWNDDAWNDDAWNDDACAMTGN
jgi:hypothetical protein